MLKNLEKHVKQLRIIAEGIRIRNRCKVEKNILTENYKASKLLHYAE